MNILVTGANGQLGNEIKIVRRTSSGRYIFTDVCDASNDSIDILTTLAGQEYNSFFKIASPI